MAKIIGMVEAGTSTMIAGRVMLLVPAVPVGDARDVSPLFVRSGVPAGYLGACHRRGKHFPAGTSPGFQEVIQ
jgi:hypothetical protein